MSDIQNRLEYLRGEIEAEQISQSELIELQNLAEYIDPTDVVLLEWAGVPEFPETVDLTPTWSGILQGLLDIVRQDRPVESVKTAEVELRNMARLADLYVQSVREPSRRQRAAALLTDTDIDGILSQAGA